MQDIEGSDQDEQDDDVESLIEVIHQLQHQFFIDIPVLDEDEEMEYKYLPGHFAVRRILSEFRGDRYLVKLMSDERQMVSESGAYPPALGTFSASCHGFFWSHAVAHRDYVFCHFML